MTPALRRLALLALGLCPAAALASDFPYPLGVTPALERFYHTGQAVAVLPEGGYAAVWEAADGSNSDVRMQWIRPDGTRVFPEGGVLVASSKDWEYNAVVIPHPRSGVFVAFVRDEVKHGPGNSRIYAQWYDGSGRRRWPGQAVAVAPVSIQESQFLPQLLPDGRDGLFACFIRNRPFTDGNDPYSEIGCQRLDAGGRRLWTNRGRLAGGTAGFRGGPLAVTDGRGGLLVFWLNLRTPLTPPHEHQLLEGQRFSPAGERLWGDTGRVIHRMDRIEEAGFRIPPFRAVPDGKGGAVLAFDDRLERGLQQQTDVVAQRVDRDGRPLWGEGTRVAAGPGHQFVNDLAAAPGGGAFVSVLGFRSGATEVLLSRLDGDGSILWGDVPAESEEPGLEVSSYLHFQPSLETLIVLWEHHVGLDPQRSEARLATFDLDGHRLSWGSMTDQASWTRPRGIAYDDRINLGLAVWETTYEGGDENTAGALFGISAKD